MRRAIEGVEPWLTDGALAAFAIRVIWRVGEQGEPAAAVEVLRAARWHRRRARGGGRNRRGGDAVHAAGGAGQGAADAWPWRPDRRRGLRPRPHPCS